VVDFFEGNRRGRRRDAAIAGGLLLLALFLFLLPAGYQRPVRQAVRGTVLQPFLSMQAELVARRNRSVDVNELRAQRDSLAALVLAQATLAEDNRRLRSLLGLSARVESEFLPTEVIWVRLPGAESTFLLPVGERHGVYVGSTVVGSGGLIGVVWEVDENTSQGIDWTHPEFAASAMTANGDVYGIVEPRRGRFREEDVLVMTQAPFHSDVRPGTRVVTSGRGLVHPRGVPLGTVVGIEEADTGWRKSYLLQPAMRPESATHALVAIRLEPGARRDLSQLWHMAPPADPTDTVAVRRMLESEAADPDSP
jgi:rod shape-determining protein MreC